MWSRRCSAQQQNLKHSPMCSICSGRYMLHQQPDRDARLTSQPQNSSSSLQWRQTRPATAVSARHLPGQGVQVRVLDSRGARRCRWSSERGLLQRNRAPNHTHFTRVPCRIDVAAGGGRLYKRGQRRLPPHKNAQCPPQPPPTRSPAAGGGELYERRGRRLAQALQPPQLFHCLPLQGDDVGPRLRVLSVRSMPACSCWKHARLRRLLPAACVRPSPPLPAQRTRVRGDADTRWFWCTCVLHPTPPPPSPLPSLACARVSSRSSPFSAISRPCRSRNRDAMVVAF